LNIEQGLTIFNFRTNHKIRGLNKTS